MSKSWQLTLLICITILMVAQPAPAIDPDATDHSIRFSIEAAPKPTDISCKQVVASMPDEITDKPYSPAPVSLDPLSLLSNRIGPMSGQELVWTMLLIALATLISEDLACISAGLLAGRGTIGLFPAVFASFAGILIGDILLYLVGRIIGQPALSRAPLKWVIKGEDIAKAAHWFSAKGPKIIITSRFLPGSRLPTYFSAGMLGTGFWRFTIYFSVAAAIWTPILVGLSALVGNRMFVYYDAFRSYGIMIVVATALLLWLSIKLIVPLFSMGGRDRVRSVLHSFSRRKNRANTFHHRNGVAAAGQRRKKNP